LNQILTQNEVDTLINGLNDGLIDTEVKGQRDPAGWQAFDFTNQTKVIKGELPTLSLINEKFTKLLRSTLSNYLGKIIESVNSDPTRIIKFGEYLKSLPFPSSLHIFKTTVPKGLALLIIDAKLVFSFIDTLLGGTGTLNSKVEGREFSIIERSLIKKIVLQILADLENSWKPVHPLEIKYVESEVTPQFINIVPPSEMVVVTSFEVDSGETLGTVTVCLPYSVVEPLKEKLSGGMNSYRFEVDSQWKKLLLSRLDEIEVDLSVDFGEIEVSGKDLLKLNQGDIIMLKGNKKNGLMGKIEGKKKIKCRAGSLKGNKAVKIVSLIK